MKEFFGIDESQETGKYTFTPDLQVGNIVFVWYA